MSNEELRASLIAELEALEVGAGDFFVKKREDERLEEQRKQDFLNDLHALINKDQDEFKLQVCDWVIDTANPEANYFKYLAGLLKRRLTNGGADKFGFITAAEWIEGEFYGNYVYRAEEFDSPYFRSICFNFFNPLAGEVENQSALFVNMVYFGVPLYKFDNFKKEYVLLDENTELYGYLKLRGKYFEGSSGFKMPDWAYEVYVNTEHVEWHYKLDNDSSYPSDDEARAKLRKLYRQMIGVTEAKSTLNDSSYGKGTKLYKLMQLVIDRYYASQFDINDSDTWPKQKDVVEWLKDEHGLSEREATAIDLVTRPDEARKK